MQYAKEIREKQSPAEVGQDAGWPECLGDQVGVEWSCSASTAGFGVIGGLPIQRQRRQWRTGRSSASLPRGAILLAASQILVVPICSVLQIYEMGLPLA